MKQEEKDLLIKDLCSRLPYGIKISKVVEDWISDPHLIRSIRLNNIIVEDGEFEDGTPDIDVWDYEDIKPYLFPLSSMNEEATREFDSTLEWITTADGYSESVLTYDSFDCLNKYHIDYRDLIPMGLAIDATGLNIY